ncbi:MAG: hypothetical protein Q4Q06_07360, partial [Bacteroidota bacterium]|nr:hypothetical protein [Bacteroidota bacterium]
MMLHIRKILLGLIFTSLLLSSCIKRGNVIEVEEEQVKTKVTQPQPTEQKQEKEKIETLILKAEDGFPYYNYTTNSIVFKYRTN